MSKGTDNYQLFNQLGELVLVVSYPKGDVLFANTTAKQWFGAPYPESFFFCLDISSKVKGKNFFTAVKNDGFADNWELNMLREGEEPVVFTCSGSWSRGAIIVIGRRGPKETARLHETLMELNSQMTNLYREMAKKTAQLEAVNKQLQQAKDDLQVASNHKSQFLANMSHELRTPLNGIIGFSEVLLYVDDSPLSQSQKEYVQNILVSGKHLLQMIEDILDLSKIEAGKFTLNFQPVCLQETVREVVNVVEGSKGSKELTISCHFSGSSLTAVGDVNRIRQILYNLLSNAIKFTPHEGTIKVRVVDKGDHLELSVGDTGIGIRKEYQEVIFERFEQVEGGYNRQYKGTGLGLPLAKSLVELQGGSIWVESEEAKGSCFFVTLPKAEPS